MTSTAVAERASVVLNLSDEQAVAEAGGEKTATTLTAPAPPPERPDGGTRAWLQVAGSFLVFGNLWGITFAFGTFQSYYELTYLPTTDVSTISWIGTPYTLHLML